MVFSGHKIMLTTGNSQHIKAIQNLEMEKRKIPFLFQVTWQINVLSDCNITVGAQDTLTCVSEHVSLQGTCPWKNLGTVRTDDLLQAIQISIPFSSQQFLLRHFLLIFTCSISVNFFEIIRGLQKWAKFISVCGSQHLLYASKLPT